MKWFKTIKEARRELKRIKEKEFDNVSEIFKWKFTKREKPFFVGSYFEWMNVK